jgi:hypothetical protein
MTDLLTGLLALAKYLALAWAIERVALGVLGLWRVVGLWRGGGGE